MFKNNIFLYTFSIGNGVLNTTLKFFPLKSVCRLNESWKTSFGGTFSPISVFLFGRLFQKPIGLTTGWTRTYHVNVMKISSKPPPLSCVLIHIFVIRDLQNEKRNPPLTHSVVEGVRIFVISFQNMVKKGKNSFYTIYSDMIMEYSGSGMILKILILYQ